MHKINTQEDLTQWAVEVNVAPFNKICDYQDVFARSDVGSLRIFYLDLERNDRDVVTFSIYKALDKQTFWWFIKAYSTRQAEEVIGREEERLADKYNELACKAFRMKEDKQQLQDENDNLRSSLTSMTCRIDLDREEIRDQAIKIRDYEALIEQLQEENDKLQSFRDTIIAGLDAKCDDCPDKINWFV